MSAKTTTPTIHHTAAVKQAELLLDEAVRILCQVGSEVDDPNLNQVRRNVQRAAIDTGALAAEYLETTGDGVVECRVVG